MSLIGFSTTLAYSQEYEGQILTLDDGTQVRYFTLDQARRLASLLSEREQLELQVENFESQIQTYDSQIARLQESILNYERQIEIYDLITNEYSDIINLQTEIINNSNDGFCSTRFCKAVVVIGVTSAAAAAILYGVSR